MSTACHFLGYQNVINPGEGDLEDELRCLWEKELSLGVLGKETHTDDARARSIVKEGVYFDEDSKQYVTPLPFNGKEEFLRTNEASARARTRNQQYLMLKDQNYMKGGVEAFEKMVEKNAVERVKDSDGEEGEVICFLPWRLVVNPENNTTT